MPEDIRKKHKAVTWGPVSLWALVVLFLSTIPCVGLPEVSIDHFDKIVHFFEYFVLSMLLVKALFDHRDDLPGKKVFLFTLIIAGMYGIVMELLQSFIPGRTPSLADVAANVLGVLAGLLLGKVVICRK